MPKLTGILLAAGLLLLPLGCNKTAVPEPRAATEAKTSRIESEAQAVKLRTQESIEDFAAETEAAVRKASKRLTSDAGKRADELSAFAAQMAEDAKDRALDIPDVVDRALERHTRRWHEKRQKSQPALDPDDWPF